jgi:serine/threonine protein kinase
LETYLNEKRKDLTEGKILNMCLQIAKGVIYLHENNVIHRDLKPSNIFLTETTENEILFKIGNNIELNEGDFGFSTISKEKSLKMTMCGTAVNILFF